MARKKGGEAAPESTIGYSHGGALFDVLQTARLRILLEALYPEHKVTQLGASTIKMRCPAPGHEDQHPSFHIFTNLNLARCKSCCYRTTNLLELMRDTLAYSYGEAVAKIHEVTGHRVGSDKVQAQLEKLDVHQQALRYIGDACNRHLQTLVSYVRDNNTVLAEDAPYYTPAVFHAVKPTLAWLFDRRGLDPHKVVYLPYGVTPSLTLLKELVHKIIDEAWSTAYKSGKPASAFTKERKDKILARVSELVDGMPVEFVHSVAFLTGFSQRSPARVRLRRVTNGETKDGNFWMTPSFTEHDPVGYLGLYHPRSNGLNMRDIDQHRVTLVEGEIDMLKAQENIIENGIPDWTFLASAGSNNELDQLHQAGFPEVDILGDHPDPNFGRGEAWVKSRLPTALHLRTNVFVGWEALRGDDLSIKDPDDVLREKGWPHFFAHIHTQRAKWFVPSNIWAAERAVEEGLEIPESDVRGRLSKASDWGQCVRHPALLAAYISDVAQKLGIPPAPLRSEIVKAKDTEAGFIARMVETIRHEFVTLYKSDLGKGAGVRLFHKQSRRYIDVPVTDSNGMLVSFSNVFGEMYTYVKDHVGMPQADPNLPDTTPSIREGQKYVGDYMKIAMQTIYQGVPSKDETSPLGAGLHYEEDPESETYTARIHNGKQWFRVGITPGSHDVKATELEGPMDNGFLYSSDVDPWSTAMTSARAFTETSRHAAALPSILKTLTEMYAEHWRFLHQDEDAHFLAAMQFVMAAGDAFESKNIVRIVGQTQSGKSTCLATFAGGQAPILQIGEQTGYMSNFTQAAIQRKFTNSTLTMVLEEFSQSASSHTNVDKQVEEVQLLLRQLIFEGGITVYRAGPHGSLTSYRIRTHAMMSSTHDPRDPQDASRAYTVETVKSTAVRDPLVQVLRQMGPHGLKDMRRSIALGILPYMPELRKNHKEVYGVLNSKQLASYVAPTRFLRHLGTVGAVFKTFGMDWEKLLTRMIESRRVKLESLEADTLINLVYDRLLRTGIIRPASSKDTAYSVMQLISSKDASGQYTGHLLLNSAGIGVLYNPAMHYLVVDWIAATSVNGIFKQVPDFARMSPFQMKHQLDQHPDLIRSSMYGEKQVMEFLAANNTQARAHELSVLDVSKLRASIASSAPAQTAKVLSLVPAADGTDNI